MRPQRLPVRPCACSLHGVGDDLTPDGDRALRLPDSPERHLALHVVLATRLLGGLVTALEGLDAADDTDQPGRQ